MPFKFRVYFSAMLFWHAILILLGLKRVEPPSPHEPFTYTEQDQKRGNFAFSRRNGWVFMQTPHDEMGFPPDAARAIGQSLIYCADLIEQEATQAKLQQAQS